MESDDEFYANCLAKIFDMQSDEFVAQAMSRSELIDMYSAVYGFMPHDFANSEDIVKDLHSFLRAHIIEKAGIKKKRSRKKKIEY